MIADWIRGMNYQTARTPDHDDDNFDRMARLGPFMVSLVIAAPALLASIVLLQWTFSWGNPGFWMLGILVIMTMNLLATVLLEPYSSALGPFTTPALLSSIALVMTYIMTDALRRYFPDIGFNWLLPFVLVGLGICYAAIFRERSILLRMYLAANGIALTILWCLGVADKVALPF